MYMYHTLTPMNLKEQYKYIYQHIEQQLRLIFKKGIETT